MQSLHCLPGLVAHHVRYRHETRRLAVHRDEDGGLAFPRQLLSLREQTVLGDARLREEAPAADENFPPSTLARIPPPETASNASASASGRPQILRASHDGLTERVLAGPLRRRHEPQELFLADPVLDEHVGQLGRRPW